MNILTNTQISLKYAVSKAAVTYWIKDAIVNKNNLKLHRNDKEKIQIIDNPHNHSELTRLAEAGKKFRRHTAHSDITPKPEFYEIFDEGEIVEMVRDLEVNNEINFKFTYKGPGAEGWDDLYNNGVESGTYLTPIKDEKMLENNFELILQRISDSVKINIIDLGPGNSKPLKNFLLKLSDLGRLNSYAAVDISPEMIEISQKNIQEWLPDLPYFSYVCDFETANFNRILEQQKAKFEYETVNIIFDLGGTLSNQNNPTLVLRNIARGMREGNIFVSTNGLDSNRTRAEFGHLKMNTAVEKVIWIPRMLNLEIEKLEFFSRYDESEDCKSQYFVLDKDYTLTIRELGKNKVLNFYKGQEIVVWKHYMTSPNGLFEYYESCGLTLVGFNMSNDHRDSLMICELNDE
jgi:SAM-dependent methyltransferase